MAYTDSTPATVVGALLVVLVVVPCLILNILFFVMYGARKRLHVPTVFMLVSLCAADMIVVCLWTLFTVVSALGGPSPFLKLDGTLCTVQVVVMTFYQLLNMHTFAILSIERVLRFWKPVVHSEVFYNDVVVIVMLVFLWIFEIICALFPVMGWGVTEFYDIRFQCGFDNPRAASRMNAMLMFNWAIPFLFTLCCFICVFKKYNDLKRRVAPDGDDGVIVQNLDYGDKFRNQQKRNDLSKSGRNPYLNDSDSDDDTNYNKIFSVVPIDSEDRVKLNGQQNHKYRLRDLELAITIMICWILFILLWIIYIAVEYIYVYDAILSLTLPDGLVTAAVFLSHVTLVMKTIVYFSHNRRFRRHLAHALGCAKQPAPPKEVNVLKVNKEPLYARKDAGGPQNVNIYRQEHAEGMGY